MALPDYSALFWITGATAVILLGIIKAGFGGGLAVIIIPVMALTIPVADAAALLLPLYIVTDLITLRLYWGKFDGQAVRKMLPGAFLGIILGTLFFTVFSDNERALKVSIGVIAVLFVLYQGGRGLWQQTLAVWKPNFLASTTLGTAAGFTSTLAHAGGPLFAIYLLPQQLPRQRFVGTTTAFFTIVNITKLIPYGILGLLRVGNLSTILLLSPLILVGVWTGLWLNRHFTDKWFSRIVYLFLLLTGIQLITGGNLMNLFANGG